MATETQGLQDSTCHPHNGLSPPFPLTIPVRYDHVTVGQVLLEVSTPIPLPVSTREFMYPCSCESDYQNLDSALGAVFSWVNG